MVLSRSANVPQLHTATSGEARASPGAAPADPVENKWPIVIFAYSVFCLTWWLVMWLGDFCYVKYGFSCKDGDAANLTMRMLAMLNLYLGAIPLVLAVKNLGNEPFLKRLAFHLQYGLMSMLWCGMARNPSPPGAGDEQDTDEESWYNVGDKFLTFVCFFLLFAYTAHSNVGESPLAVMVQPTHKGHGILPRTFLLLFCLAGILPLVSGVFF